MKFSSKILKCQLSPVRKFNPCADQAVAAGRTIYHLNIGQPDVKTPESFYQAVREFREPTLEYAPASGLPAYIDAVRGYYAKLGVKLEREDILATSGGGEALEFIMACILDDGDELLVPEPFYPIGDKLHRKLMRDFRLYMLVGGMPQAVNEYLQTNNFRKVDTIKRDILNLYEDDFKKIDSTGKLSLLFDAIPAQLNKNAARYQVSSVLANDRADSILELIAELKDSKTVLVSYHANDPNAGMSTNKDLCKFKLFLCDTGLFTTLMFKDKDFTENIIYEKLLNDTLNTNLGYLYENIVAQILTCNGNELFYYTFFNETSRHNYEIDFLLASRNKICPIEVKSSGYKTHKSLDEFCKKYSDRILDKYLVYTKDLAKDSDILCLPVYMVPFL